MHLRTTLAQIAIVVSTVESAQFSDKDHGRKAHHNAPKNSLVACIFHIRSVHCSQRELTNGDYIANLQLLVDAMQIQHIKFTTEIDLLHEKASSMHTLAASFGSILRMILRVVAMSRNSEASKLLRLDISPLCTPRLFTAQHDHIIRSQKLEIQ